MRADRQAASMTKVFRRSLQLAAASRRYYQKNRVAILQHKKDGYAPRYPLATVPETCQITPLGSSRCSVLGAYHVCQKDEAHGGNEHECVCGWLWLEWDAKRSV